MPAELPARDPVMAAQAVAAVPGATTGDPILTLTELRRRFGGLVAVDVDHLEVERNRITALIGPNGAGKTTLFNVLTGFDRADRGQWTFDGRSMHSLPAYAVARAGLVRTFQLTKALARMSVLDNMMLAAAGQRGERLRNSMFARTWRSQERAIRSRALEQLERFSLAHMHSDYAGTLSGGQRKLLEIARALMAEPRMLLLDEPTAGVNPALVQSILEHVKGLRDDGMTVLFVEHDMDVVRGISDWVVCMAEGRIIADGLPASIVANEAVIDAYLGTRRAGGRR